MNEISDGGEMPGITSRIGHQLDRIRNENGQTLVEYSLIIALISVALVGSLTALNVGIGGMFTNIIAQF
jgi:Flp pilus assembly pilin Flp